MPLRTMLTQHILDKPLMPSCTSQYFSCTKCSYEGLNSTWKKRGLLKRGPQERLDHECSALGVVIADCDHLQSAGCEGLPWARESTRAHWRMQKHAKTLHDQVMLRVNVPNVPLQGLQPALRHIERFSASSFSSSCRVEEHEPTPASLGLEGLPTPGAHRPSPFRRRSFLANGWRFPHRICE